MSDTVCWGSNSLSGGQSVLPPISSSIALSQVPYGASQQYTAYGLQIDSELALPHLRPGNGIADICVRYGEVPQALEGATHLGSNWQLAPDQFLLHIEGVAGYWAQGTGAITIARAVGAKDSDIRIFLLGSVLGFLLHQRRILPIHASAIRTERGAVLFTGASGAGKSTTLGAMVKRGYAMLADDVSGVTLSDTGQPIVLPAFPSSRLWADAAQKLEHSTSGVNRVRADYDKYVFPVSDFCPEPVPLLGIYVLTQHGRPTIELIPIRETMQKFLSLAVNTYRKVFIQATGWEQENFQMVSNLLQSVYVTQVKRPVDGYLLNELAERIEQDFNRSR